VALLGSCEHWVVDLGPIEAVFATLPPTNAADCAILEKPPDWMRGWLLRQDDAGVVPLCLAAIATQREQFLALQQVLRH